MNLRILYLAKLSFKNKSDIKAFWTKIRIYHRWGTFTFILE